MNDDNEDFAKSTVAPIGAGLITTFIARIILPIRKELSIFKKIDGNEILAGLVDGIGNVRNLVATAIGAAAMVGTFLIINGKEDKKKQQPLGEVPEVPKDVVETNEQMGLWEKRVISQKNRVSHRG